MRFLMLNWRDPKNPLAGGAERFGWLIFRARAARTRAWFTHDTRAPAEEVVDGIHYIARRDGT
jgi:hypothetical protein